MGRGPAFWSRFRRRSQGFLEFAPVCAILLSVFGIRVPAGSRPSAQQRRSLQEATDQYGRQNIRAASSIGRAADS